MKKITVMIADDERMALDHLQHIYDWEGNGFSIVATAINGKQALLKFQKLSPQIVITDIKMPSMDGIELIRQIRKISAGTKILLLTAFGEFEYAKRAINQGVNDYLLKNEMTGDILAQKLSELKEQILTEGVTQNLALRQAVTNYFKSADGSQNEFFPEPAIKKVLDKNYYYFTVKEDMPISFSLNPKRQFTSRYENQIIALCLSASLPDSAPMVVCAAALPDNEMILMITAEEVPSAAERTKLHAFAVLIRDRLLQQLNSSFSLFIQYTPMTPEQFHLNFGRCKRLMESKFFFGTGNIYDLNSSSLVPRRSGVVVNTAMLEQLLTEGDFDRVKNYIESLFQSLYMDYDALVLALQTCYFLLKQLFDTLPSSVDPVEAKLSQDEFLLRDIAGIKNWITNSMQQYLDAKEKQLKLKYSHEILRTIQYIQNHYKNQDLKISAIAEYVGLSSARLSVVFKKETGQTINEFITNLRIGKAKELLDSGIYKVYEIADMVGYGSSQYFSHLFYTLTGVNPFEYKKGGIS